MGVISTKGIFAVAVAGLMIASCEPKGPAKSGGVEITPPTVDVPVEEPVVEVWTEPESWAVFRAPEQGEAPVDLFSSLRAGENFYVAFDSCPYDDSGWEEENDPLAALRCEYTYYAVQDAGVVTFTGPMESIDSVFSAEGSVNLYSDTGDLAVWGVPLTITADGEVFDGGDNMIGHVGLGTLSEN